MTTSRPAVILSMVRRKRIDGTPFLVALVNEDMTFPAGTELHLRRLREAGPGEAAEFALQVITPRQRWQPTKSERAEAASGRLDGAAVRTDGRPSEEAP